MTFVPDYDDTKVDAQDLAQARSTTSEVEEGFPTRTDEKAARKDARKAGK